MNVTHNTSNLIRRDVHIVKQLPNGVIISSDGKYSTKVPEPFVLVRGSVVSTLLDEERTYYYNLFGQVHSIYIAGTLYTYKYDSSGNIITVSVSGPNVKPKEWAYEYTASGKVVKHTNHSGRVTTYTYNQYGLLTSVADFVGTTVTYEYNYRNLLIREYTRYGHNKAYEYDDKGRLTHEYNINRLCCTYTYDSEDRLIQEYYANGTIWTYKYNSDGLLCSKTSVSRMLSPSYADSDCMWTYEYNSDKQCVKKESSKGHRYLYTYDSNKQVLEEVYSCCDFGHTKSYEYDEKGRLVREKFSNTTYPV